MITADIIRQTGYGELINYRSSATNVVIDSRRVSDNSIFVALPGEKTDGHRFIRQALSSGAVLCVVSKEWAQHNTHQHLPLWITESPETALQKLAQVWRNQFQIPMLAITGTNGKTTTRAMCAAILARKFKLHTTAGNLNNQLGVPLSLLTLTPDHTFSLLEFGTNHFGEIALLCKLAKPNAALITNIGYGHTEFFGSKAGVARAKRELFDALETDDTGFINLNDEYIREMNPRCHQVTYGMETEHADYTGKIIRFDKNGCATLNINGDIRIELKTPGKVMAQNALAAAAVGLYFDVRPDDIITGLESFTPVQQRFDMLRTPHCRIINDAYNANPDSTQAAINTFTSLRLPGRRILVFGDMFELGTLAKTCHRDIGQLIAESPIDRVYLYGPLTEITHAAIQAAGGPPSRHFSTKDNLLEALQKEIKSDDTVLVKGSRGNQLEDIIEGLMN